MAATDEPNAVLVTGASGYYEMFNEPRGGLGPNLDTIHTSIYKTAMTSDPASLLREQGIQVTAQRLAVLRAVSGRPYGTADVIAEDVRADIGAVSPQAVYDTQ